MRKNGFTLIELVIAMGIVGILIAIAVPAYGAYVKRANRTDATRSMTIAAQALERCYSQQFSYSSCPGAGLGTTPSAQGYYNITVALGGTTSSFIITAVPIKSPQTADSACTQFTLNSAGTQGAIDSSSSPNTQSCWGST